MLDDFHIAFEYVRETGREWKNYEEPKREVHTSIFDPRKPGPVQKPKLTIDNILDML